MLGVLPKDFPKGFFRFGIFPPAQIDLTQVVVGLDENRFDANGLDIFFNGTIFLTQFCQRVSMIEEHDLDTRIDLLCALEIRIRLGVIVAVKGPFPTVYRALNSSLLRSRSSASASISPA